MELKIVRPSSTATHTINWIELESLKGNLVVQPGHAPAFVIIKPESNFQWEETNGTVESITIPKGILEINRKTARLIIQPNT